MSENISKSCFVTYFIEKNPRLNVRNTASFTNNSPEQNNMKRSSVDEYIHEHSGTIVAEFVEYIDPKKTSNHTWQELQKAINLCKQNQATLVINEIGNLTNNYAFSELLIEADINFHCCDLKFLDKENLKVIRQHAQIQRQLHGELIRAGLKQTSAKSGNPNAAEVISKVNKPKIDTAIVFACLLQPIIASYRRKGYSQRQMVKTLNDEGFSAPEGGKWVLSQLQKVLDRVRLNEIAFENREFVTELRSRDLREDQIAEQLNQKAISSPKRSAWDQTQVKKLINRLDQIQDIELINQFVLDLLPIIHSYRQKGEAAIEIIKQFDRIGLVIKSKEEQQQAALA